MPMKHFSLMKTTLEIDEMKFKTLLNICLTDDNIFEIIIGQIVKYFA